MIARVRGFIPDLLSFSVRTQSILRSGLARQRVSSLVTLLLRSLPLRARVGAHHLEVTMRIFRGGSVIYAAATDLAIPGQTRALAQRDVKRMYGRPCLRSDYAAIPALIACTVLLFFGGPFFKFLLKSAAPSANSHTCPCRSDTRKCRADGFRIAAPAHRLFPRLRPYRLAVSTLLVAAMTLTYFAGFDIVGFLTVYAAVFTIGAR